MYTAWRKNAFLLHWFEEIFSAYVLVWESLILVKLLFKLSLFLICVWQAWCLTILGHVCFIYTLYHFVSNMTHNFLDNSIIILRTFFTIFWLWTCWSSPRISFDVSWRKCLNWVWNFVMKPRFYFSKKFMSVFEYFWTFINVSWTSCESLVNVKVLWTFCKCLLNLL